MITYAVKKDNQNNIELNIILTNNKEIQKLNKIYRGIDKATDVLSFLLQDDIINKYYQKEFLGDIYISVEKAKVQAQLSNHSLLDELSFLVIHGFLHLLGYNHEIGEDQKIMFSRQEEILNEYKCKR